MPHNGEEMARQRGPTGASEGVLRLTAYAAVVLGVVQGLTEFLPVSSSGHLVIAQHLLGLPAGTLTFDVMVHLGTLLAVIVTFRREVLAVLSGLRPGGDQAGRRLLLLLMVGTVPAVLAGFLLQDVVETLFSSLYTVGAMLLVTGTVLFLAERASGGDTPLGSMRLGDALLVGCGQALAIMPGLSRSGTTISAGLLRGVKRDDAARFSFLLSIPVILGAAVLELPNALLGAAGASPLVLAIGLATSAVTGYLAIALLVRLIRRRSLVAFAYYTWGAGALVLLLTYLRN